jgi:Tfp pilus assembly protein PilO
MNAYLNRLSKFDPRLLMLGAAVILFLLAFESWTLLLKPQVAALKLKQQEKESLERSTRDAQVLPAQIEKMKQDIAGLNGQIMGSKINLSADQMVVRMVDDLSRIGKRYAVSVSSVRPGEPKSVMMFNEISFDVAAKGSYASLYEWMTAIEKELGPLVVTQLGLQAQAPNSPLTLTLKLAAYHLPGEEGKK